MSDLVIDFTPLMADGKRFAVYIQTEEDAYEFLKQYKESFPHKFRGWSLADIHFDAYERICYRPNLNMPDPITLKYCSYQYYEENGFTIIPFEDLIVHSEILESDCEISTLFAK